MSKKTHREVHYHDATDKKKSCGTCAMFIDSDPPRCTLVASPIRASDTCDRWTRRE